MAIEEQLRGIRALSDDELQASLRGVLGSSRKLVALLLAHLGEVEQRRLHLVAGHESMFTYCTRRLGMSEDEACRRIDVARLARRFPALLEPLAIGQLSLSVAALLKHHLTESNHPALIAAVSGKTVSRARDALAAWFPRPDVPATIRKLPQRRVSAGGTSEPDARATADPLFASARSPAEDVVHVPGPARFDETSERPRDDGCPGTNGDDKPTTEPRATENATSTPTCHGRFDSDSTHVPKAGATAAPPSSAHVPASDAMIEQAAADTPAVDPVIARREPSDPLTAEHPGAEYVAVWRATSEPATAEHLGAEPVAVWRTTYGPVTAEHPGAEHVATWRATSEPATAARFAVGRVPSGPVTAEPPGAEHPAAERAASERAVADAGAASEHAVADSGATHPVAAERGANEHAAASQAGAQPFAAAPSELFASPCAVRASRSYTIEPLSPERYRVQFTADAALKQKLELARDLLRHSVPSGDLPAIIGRALDLLLEKTLQRRFAKTDRAKGERASKPRSDASSMSAATRAPVCKIVEPYEPSTESSSSTAPATIDTEPESTVMTNGATASEEPDHAAQPPAGEALDVPRTSAKARPVAEQNPSRYLPSNVRRAVLERDGLRCTWVAQDGSRCECRSWLEYDHIIPRGLGGSDDPTNIRIRCRAHNQLAAERAYGKAAIARIVTGRRAARRASENQPAPDAARPAPT